MRRCIGCMESKPKTELTRVAYYQGKLTVDVKGTAKGRGVYLCADPKCHELAKKKNAFQRSFKCGFDGETIDKIFQELMDVKR